MWWMALLGAGLGAGIGGLSKWRDRKYEREKLEREKENARKQYEYGKQYSDRMFDLKKDEAIGQLDIQREGLDTQLGLTFDDYNTNLLAQAFGIQDARIQTSSSIGDSIAAEGASGTRGNSSGEMIRAYAAQGLERNIDLQERKNSNYLNQVITGANQTADAINRERASWMPGGYRVQEKDAQDSYNQQIYQLGQDNYNWQMQQHESYKFLDYFTGVLSGANSGFGAGVGFGNFWNQVGK